MDGFLNMQEQSDALIRFHSARSSHCTGGHAKVPIFIHVFLWDRAVALPGGANRFRVAPPHALAFYHLKFNWHPLQMRIKYSLRRLNFLLRVKSSVMEQR
jgi:hypothetical protein